MQSLTNHFLIAMPMLGDPNFNESVTYICQHDDEGALGIVINRPGEFTVGDICSQLGFEVTDGPLTRQPVLAGGPVEPARGFVLHRSELEYDSTLYVNTEIRLTASRDILEQIASNEGPKEALLALGYAGWGAGQLESELAANAWLSAPATGEILFETPYLERWAAAAGLIGIDIRGISNYSGHA